MGCNQSKLALASSNTRKSINRIIDRKEYLWDLKDDGAGTTQEKALRLEDDFHSDSNGYDYSAAPRIIAPRKAAANSVAAARGAPAEDARSTDSDIDFELYYGKKPPEKEKKQPENNPCPDPRLQILTYFNNVSQELTTDTTENEDDFSSLGENASVATLPSLAENSSSLQVQAPSVTISQKPLSSRSISSSQKPLSSRSQISPSIFTVWRPTSSEAIRKMVEGIGVGKGLEIKGKSSKAGALSGFVPYLQIHQEEHKSSVKTIDRGGRTRIFFATEEARDTVLEELGPLQNNILNAVQDAKRTVKMGVTQVLYVPHHAKKKVKKAGKVAKKTAVMAGSTVSHATATVSTSVVTAGSAVAGGASVVAEGAMKGLTQGKDSVVDSVREISDSIRGVSRRASTGVTSAGEKLAPITSPVKVIHHSLRKITVPVGTKVDSLLTPVGDGVKKGAGTVKKGVKKAGGGVVKGVTTAGGGVVKGVKMAGGGVVKGVSMAGGGVVKGVTTAGGGVAKGVSMAGGGVVKGVSMAGEGVVMGVTTAGGGVVKGVSKAGKLGKKVVTQATSTVADSTVVSAASSTPVGQGIRKRASMISATAASAVGISDDANDDVEFALKRLLWDMDDPSIRKIDDYNPQCYGIELPDRLLWQAFVIDSDISRPEGSRWYTARPSQPAFQDMNLIAISKSYKKQKKKNKKITIKKKKKKSEDPLVVLWQTCTGDGDGDDPMDPRGLVMAYEECGRVLPVVSDFDCFTMGSTQINYEVLPEDQVKLLDWCISNIEDVLENQKSSKNATWTDRWLSVLKASAMKGFHPEIPKYGFGDAKSYDIVKNAVNYLRSSGAVRHGAECFNFYFPQDLDDEFLIVSELVPNNPKWQYVNVEELLDFLFERVKEGYTFPLNPKWVLCDDARWKELFDCLQASEAPCVQESLEAWVPHSVRDKIESIRARHPDGFLSDKPRDDEVCGTEAMDLAMLDLDRLLIFRRARQKLWTMCLFINLLQKVRKKRAEQESSGDKDSDEEGGSREAPGGGENLNGMDGDEMSKDTPRSPDNGKDGDENEGSEEAAEEGENLNGMDGDEISKDTPRSPDNGKDGDENEGSEEAAEEGENSNGMDGDELSKDTPRSPDNGKDGDEKEGLEEAPEESERPSGMDDDELPKEIVRSSDNGTDGSGEATEEGERSNGMDGDELPKETLRSSDNGKDEGEEEGSEEGDSLICENRSDGTSNASLPSLDNEEGGDEEEEPKESREDEAKSNTEVPGEKTPPSSNNVHDEGKEEGPEEVWEYVVGLNDGDKSGALPKKPRRSMNSYIGGDKEEGSKEALEDGGSGGSVNGDTMSVGTSRSSIVLMDGTVLFC